MYIEYITLNSYALYLSPKRGFEHVTEYLPEVVAEGRYSVMCSNPRFGDKYNAYELNVIYLILYIFVKSI